MKNLMTIFSVVVLFAFAMTTIGCDKKKGSTATFTVTVPDDGYPINADGTLDATKNNTAADLALSKLPKEDKEYKVTVIKVKKLGDTVTAAVIGTTNIAKDTDTGKVSVEWKIDDPAPATGKDAEYEFHALATSVAFIAPTATVKTLADAWTEIEKAQVDANKKSTILATAKSFKKGTIKKATS